MHPFFIICLADGIQERIQNGRDFFNYLHHAGNVGPNLLSHLEDLLRKIHRMDLAMKVREFQDQQMGKFCLRTLWQILKKWNKELLERINSGVLCVGKYWLGSFLLYWIIGCLFIMAIDIILFDVLYLLFLCDWKTGIHSFVMDLTLCFKQVEEWLLLQAAVDWNNESWI